MALSSERLLEIIRFQNEVIAGDLSVGQAMEAIVARAQALTRAAGAVIEICEDADMVYRAASGTLAPHVGMRLKAATSLSGLSMRLAEIQHCEDSEEDARVDRQACRRINVRSMICVPLIHRGEPIGALKVAAPQPRAFNDNDVQTLNLLSGLLAAHLRHAGELDLKRRESEVDALTGLHNRRAYDAALRDEMKRAARLNIPLSLIMVDLDGFKKANDELGHPAGDEVLRQTAQILRKHVRSSDVCFRLGGDEFGVLLAGADSARVARIVEDMTATMDGGPLAEGRVRASIAGVQAAPGETAEAFHARADAALYARKALRRAAR